MKRWRIFIAINLPEDIKQKLGDYQKKIEELFTPYRSEASGSGPINWTKQDNIHITLSFLGYIADEELIDVCKSVKETGSKHSSFSVNLFKICYGPLRLRSGQAPRMIWAIGEKSEEFASLKDDLDKALDNSEKRQFSPHITLGRIRKWEWQRIEPEERPSVDEEIDLSFPVDSIEVVESVLKKRGPEYTILESYNLL
jgi:2'-5' RNA ligase